MLVVSRYKVVVGHENYTAPCNPVEYANGDISAGIFFGLIL